MKSSSKKSKKVDKHIAKDVMKDVLKNKSVSDLKIDTIYDHFNSEKGYIYDQEKHCKLMIKIMLDPDKGTVPAFCVDALVSEKTFWTWVATHQLFGNLYYFTKMIAREIWEKEGRRIRDEQYPMGTINHAFEHWKMIGWSRFGISKNSRIKLNLNPTDNPAQHYAAILKQASEGDFTASEFKQLMETVSVGLNVFNTFELQKQIDELKSNLSTMQANTNASHPFSDKGIT